MQKYQVVGVVMAAGVLCVWLCACVCVRAQSSAPERLNKHGESAAISRHLV